MPLVLNWIIDQLITDRAREYPGVIPLADAARDKGHRVFETRYLLGESDQEFSGRIFELLRPIVTIGGPTIVHGSHLFVSKMKRTFPAVIAYHQLEHLSVSAFSARLGGEILLNDDYVILPFAELARRTPPEAGYFIRPNAVTKAFSGRAVSGADWHHEISMLRKVEHVDEDLLVVLATIKPILGEFRFVISGGKVITGSEYRWDDILDVRTDVSPDCLALAEKIAGNPWQADDVYTCDIALTKDARGAPVAKLLELNAFSCSGLYACDAGAIVDAVARSIAGEYDMIESVISWGAVS